MSGRLARITDWEEKAEAANYHPDALAQQLSVCLRQLERFFAEKLGKTPRDWLNEQRQLKALHALIAGSSVKEAATVAGYEHACHLSRDFKKFFGFPPSAVSDAAVLPKMSPVGTEMSRFGRSTGLMRSPPGA